MADEQQKDDKVKEDPSLEGKGHPVSSGTKTLLCNVGTGYSKPYILLSLRRIFKQFQKYVKLPTN